MTLGQFREMLEAITERGEWENRRITETRGLGVDFGSGPELGVLFLHLSAGPGDPPEGPPTALIVDHRVVDLPGFEGFLKEHGFE